jgi:hypothetical protein
MPSLASESPDGAWRPSVAHIALLLPWVMVVIAARLPVRDNSFLWHVTAGRLQIDGGAVLTTDPFSFTFVGEAWRTQSWLMDVAYAWLDARFSLGYAAVVVAASALATFAFVLLVVWRVTSSLEATVLAGVMATWLSAIFLNPRPVLFSYLLMAVTVGVCLDRRLRWVLPLLAWTWAAVHGSFVLGIGYVVLDGLRRRDRRAVVDVVAMTAAATITAHGFGVWELLYQFLGSSEALGLITEWRTPDFTGVALLPFLIGIVLLIVAGMRGNLRPADLWVLVPFLVFGMTATRAVWPAWIPLAPLAALALRDLPRVSRDSGASRRVLVAVGIGVLVLPFAIPIEATFNEEFPVAASRELSAVPTFHDDRTGGYLIYALGPEFPVFVDDRAELYGAEHLRDVVATRSGTPQWREVFDRWKISQALLRPDDGLVEALEQSGWIRTHTDEEFVVLTAR